MSTYNETVAFDAGQNKGRTVRSETEPVVVRLRRHGRILFMPSLALIGIATALGFFSEGFPELWMNLVFWIGLAFLLIVLWIFPLVVWLGNRVVITTRRVVIYRGVFTRSKQEVLFGRIHDVTVRQNAVQAVFGAGDLLLNTGAEKPIRLYDLPKANLVLSALTELVDSQAPLSAQLRRDDQRWTSEI